MDREFKVGVFVVVATAVLIGFLMYSGKLQLMGKFYTLYVDFPYVEGLKEGAEVRELGVTVGKVTDIKIVNASRVRVRIILKKGYPLREGSRFYISTEGVLGSKILEIEPSPNGTNIPNGSVVIGEAPVRFRDMIAMLDRSVRRFSDILSSFKEFWEEKGAEKRLLALLKNLQEGSERISDVIAKVNGITDSFSEKFSRLSDESGLLVSELREIVRSNKKSIQTVVRRLNNILADLRILSKEIRNRPQLVKNLDETIISIKKAANSTSRFMKLLSGETAGKSSTGNKGILASIRKIEKMTREAEKAVRNIRSWRVNGGIRLRYGKEEGETLSDIWVTLSREGSDTSLFLGVDDVGGGSYFSGLFERFISKNAQIRYGIIRGDLGVSYRYYFSNSAYISTDMKIAHNWETGIDVYYPASQRYGIFLRLDDLFDERRFYIGADYRF